jgi:hypothetical protein
MEQAWNSPNCPNKAVGFAEAVEPRSAATRHCHASNGGLENDKPSPRGCQGLGLSQMPCAAPFVVIVVHLRRLRKSWWRRSKTIHGPMVVVASS